MTPESVMMMGTEAMKVALALAAPLLLVALITGLIISILQAATQDVFAAPPGLLCVFAPQRYAGLFLPLQSRETRRLTLIKA
ncbi:flagellar biosynthetic protein FliQ [Salmonella enterica subsp. enterica serovar Typhi]|nr:flagellar biosynthetic protein FliQ [Salmonella enterica subsp. enterica serovar Typhi]